MATLIRLKRKKSSGNSGVVLAAGEAYYNTADKRLYIGNTDGEDVSSNSKKHIVQITPIDAGATTVKFQLGEDENNVYEKKITADAIEGTISNAKDATNVSSTIAGTAISSLFNMSSSKPTSAKKATQADSATKATYASDDTSTSIGARFSTLTSDVAELSEDLATSKTTLQGNIDTLSRTVASNKTTTDAVITKIINGSTTVAKATNATSASSANDLANLSLSSSSGATIKLTWGPKSEYNTSFVVAGESIGGTVTSAENVTKTINGTNITDIFESSGVVVKKASKLNNARKLTAKLNSTTAGSFDGSADVNIGVTGTLPIANGGTGATTAAGALTNLGISATAAELNYLEDATSNIQSQLNGKQTKITGGATTIVSTNLTTSRALISDANGKVAVSDVSSTELKYLDGVKSNIQTQLDGKAASSHGAHLPAKQTADSATFLRNDHSWQKVTPSAIGAAASSHNHAASTITSGTLDSNRLPTVPITKGGTGATTALGAEYAISGAMASATTAVGNDTQIVYKVTTPSAAQGVFRYRPASDLWTYIKGKSDSTYSAKSHTHTELEWKSFD